MTPNFTSVDGSSFRTRMHPPIFAPCQSHDYDAPDSTSHLVASRITALVDGGGRGGATPGRCCHLSQTGRTCGNAGNAARLRLLWTREPIQSAAEFSPICECENIFVLSLSVGLIRKAIGSTKVPVTISRPLGPLVSRKIR